VLDIYETTRAFPACERYGLQSQIRRAAVSTVCNIVEGSARRSDAEYLNFLNIANGSAHELRYLVELTHRLQILSETDFAPVHKKAALLTAGLGALIRSLSPDPQRE
jgi:four helix bundle protein